MKKQYKLVLSSNSELKHKVKSLEAEGLKIKRQKLALQKSVSHFKTKCEKLKNEKTSVDEAAIQHILNDTTPALKTTRDRTCNRFTDDVRMTIIGLQEAGVAASKCSEVIGIVARHLFGQELFDLPSASTSTNIADEGHYLSKVHATERILKSSNVTLHTDGTSRQKQSYVGQQMTLSDGTLVSLGFTEVASEDSNTLMSITISLLDELSDIYCQVTEKEKGTVFKQLLERITSLMSDRAAVMQCYNKKFDTYRTTTLQTDTHMHFLYCNAHFLLGLSSSCEAGLKEIEKDICNAGSALGRDSAPQFKNWGSSSEAATARLIRTTADVLGPCGDEKSGCRTEWLAFCKKESHQSEITSYRSNRFNSLFENATAIFHHRSHIQLFLSRFATSANLKLQSVLADISDHRLHSLLAAVGLLHTYLTVPYWNLINSSVQYVDFHLYVKKMVLNLDRWHEDPCSLFNTECRGAFDGEFLDEIDTSLHAVAQENSALVTSCLCRMLGKVIEVTKRQLNDFLEGGVFAVDVSEETRAALKSCPLTNLSGEHAFGDLDYSMQIKRHSSLHHRSTSNMLKRNKTTAWLKDKSNSERHSVLETSRKQAKLLRRRHRQQEDLVRLRIQERIAENDRKRKEKELQAAAEKQRIIDCVIKCGGPVKSAEDVQLMLRQSGSGLEALKDQLRYIKVVLGVKKIKLTGNKAQLEAALCEYLTTGKAAVDSSPPRKRRRIEEDEEFNDSDSSCSSSDGDENDPPVRHFTFERQGQWVAVYYDFSFYIGQVIDVKAASSATIKFLAATKGRKDYYRWPLSDDIAEVDSTFVFKWDFNVTPVSSDGRMWCIHEVNSISKAYERIRTAHH